MPLSDDGRPASSRTIDAGAEALHGIKDVGGGMMMATFKDASGNIFGIIDNHNA